MANNNGWYYLLNGEKRGPIDSVELKHMARVGELNLADHVWNESLPDWIPASRIKGLFPPPLPVAAAKAPGANSGEAAAASRRSHPAPIFLPPVPNQHDNNSNRTPRSAESLVLGDNEPFCSGFSTDTATPVAKSITSPNVASDDFQKAAIRRQADGATASPGPKGLSTTATTGPHPSNARPAFAVSTPDPAHPQSPSRGNQPFTPAADSPAATLKTYLSEDLWRQLVAAGMRWESIVYWIRIQNAKTRELKSGQPSRNVSDFLKSVSNKVSSAIEQSNVVDANRVLVVTNAGPMFIVGQFALAPKICSFAKEEFRIDVRMNGSQLEIELNELQPLREIQQATMRFDLSTETLPPFGGRLESFIGGWLKQRSHGSDQTLLQFPVFLRVSHWRRGSFIQPIASSLASWVSISHTGFRLFSDQFDRGFEFTQIIHWREMQQGLEFLAWSEDGICRLWITPHGAVPIPADSEQLSLQATGASATSGHLFTSKPDPADDAGSIAFNHPGKASMRILREAFRTHAADVQSFLPFFAVELSVTPVFENESVPVGMTYDGEQFRTWIGAGEFQKRIVDKGFICYEFPAGRFLQTNGDFFRVELPTECAELWKTLCLSSENRIRIRDTGVTLATMECTESPRAVPVTLQLDEAGQIHLAYGRDDEQILSSLQLSSGSLSWTKLCGQVQILHAENDGAIKVTASPAAIVDLWKGKEQYALRVSTDGLRLGGLYDEFARRRTDKFLAGVFGSLIVTQEQLEIDGTVAEFLNEMNAAPAGPLSDEMSARLVQRLSILEISRQQLGRWFDRCSLFLPHFWSKLERDWLEETFGDTVVDKQRRDREAWRVQQTIRSELRQVQASLGRPLQELGQNLNAVSFAFPEEVRCASLASVRNAAGLAEKGAMLSAFGGIGAQVLMGLGRASMGDPIGIAILGTMGLGLVGKHLQQKAKNVEQKIRLRAYGSQALQWWGVVLESGFVMAFECRQSIAQLERSRFERDKKLLEGLPLEQLPVVQRRMVSVMRKWLEESTDSQFYEVLPGSGLYGHQLVQRVADSTGSQASLLISEFGYELPGSSKKV